MNSWGVSGEYEYFILFNYIELYWISNRILTVNVTGCFIFLTELDWVNFALDSFADFDWLNTEQLYLDVSLYLNTGIEKFSWGWISIRIHTRYSVNSTVNIRIRRIWILFHFVTSLDYWISHHTLTVSLHNLVKYKCKKKQQ